MGALDHLSDLFDCSRASSKHKKRKALQVLLHTALLHLLRLYFLLGVDRVIYAYDTYLYF